MVAKRIATLLLAAAIGLTGFTGVAHSVSAKLVSKMESSWIGRYAKRDEGIRKIIAGSEGWAKYRDMDLFEAIRFFSSETDPASRIGAARSHLELSDTFRALDELTCDVEIQYLEELGGAATPGQHVRLGFAYLKRGDLKKAKAVFSKNPPKGQKLSWTLGNVGLALASSQKVDAKGELTRLLSGASKDDASLIKVAAYVWGVPIPAENIGYYGQALTAINQNDLFGAMVALQMLDNQTSKQAPDADMFIYPLFQEVFARMAAAALTGLEGRESAYLMGHAKMLLKDYEGAGAAFASVRTSASNPQTVIPLLVFGPELDEVEMVEISQVYEGLAKYRAKKAADASKIWADLKKTEQDGSFALARMAAAKVEAGLDNLGAEELKTGARAVADANELILRAAKSEGGDLATKLLDARSARVARDVAIIDRKLQKPREALDVLDQAHVKRMGNKPSYINPPTFQIDLARAYAELGEFAPAVEILFELSNQLPSSRLAYESLKRLYASTTGGEAPPR